MNIIETAGNITVEFEIDGVPHIRKFTREYIDGYTYESDIKPLILAELKKEFSGECK